MMAEYLLDEHFYIWYGVEEQTGLSLVAIGCQFPWGVAAHVFTLDEWLDFLNGEIERASNIRTKIPKAIAKAFGE